MEQSVLTSAAPSGTPPSPLAPAGCPGSDRTVETASAAVPATHGRPFTVNVRRSIAKHENANIGTTDLNVRKDRISKTGEIRWKQDTERQVPEGLGRANTVQ